MLHRNTSELRDGARQSCYFCLRFFDDYMEYSITPLDLVRTQIETLCSRPDSHYLWIASDSSTYYHEVLFEIRYQILKWTSLSRSTDSDESWNFITSSLRDCDDNHVLCRTTSSDFVPSRLIEISKVEGSVKFRIITTSDDWAGAPYVTLSHRWGSQTTSRLTTGNMAEFMRNIPVTCMPKKFLDTAVVAERLNIKYMWIDSLVSC